MNPRRQTGATVPHVTHNRSEAERLADRVFEPLFAPGGAPGEFAAGPDLATLDVAVSVADELTVETSAPLVVTAVELRSP